MITKKLLVIAMLGLWVGIVPVQAQIGKPWTYGPSACKYVDEYGNEIATLKGVECILSNFLNIAITIIGIAILLMFVYGAFQILISGGDPKNVEAGKNTLTYAIIGLVVAVSSWFIISLIATFTGAENIKTFSIICPEAICPSTR